MCLKEKHLARFHIVRCTARSLGEIILNKGGGGGGGAWRGGKEK